MLHLCEICQSRWHKNKGCYCCRITWRSECSKSKELPLFRTWTFCLQRRWVRFSPLNWQKGQTPCTVLRLGQKTGRSIEQVLYSQPHTHTESVQCTQSTHRLFFCRNNTMQGQEKRCRTAAWLSGFSAGSASACEINATGKHSRKILFENH